MTSAPAENSGLPPALAALAADQARAGGYADANAVIAAGLQALANATSDAGNAADWPIGGGDCGAIIRRHDWANNPLGPRENWSATLRTTVANIVNSPIAKVVMWGPRHVMLYNDAYAVIAGAKHPAALGGMVEQVWPEIWDWNDKMLAAGMRGESLSFHDQPLTLIRGDGPETVIFDLFYTPVYKLDGSIGGVMCTCVDNSARIAAEKMRIQTETDLHASNSRFRAAMDAVNGVLWTNNAHGEMIGEQPGWAALTGQTQEQYAGYGWADAVDPADREASVVTWRAAVAAKAIYVHEHRVRRHCGTWRTFSVRALPILDEAGEIMEWVGVHTDISHQRAAESALRKQAESLARLAQHRKRAEEQLRHLNETLEARVIAEIGERQLTEVKLAQAQKLETIGKLSGGVAHDFNNLLQIIAGNLQLLAKDIAGNARAEHRVANAMAGVSRGGKLASQLLAFGRRQPLEPKVANVSRVVRGMDDMLRRAIGEGIELETIVAGGLWNSFIDPGQVENALLNLAINARDAMDGQGKLTIEVGNTLLDADYARANDEVTPGQYVMLAVTDSGVGMTPDILAQVFEPFFSTKGEGKGSGLGLSMVYGFVKQSGGHVKIYSEPGEGTTVRLYMPRSMESEDIEVQVENGPISGGSETVLVVEDDEDVRNTVVEILSDLGYRVLTAPDAASALIVVESGIPIDMLFTDVVMPGTMKSPELARKARQRLPGIAILFTSGYTENSIVHGGKLDAGVELLSKPYTREALARRFRHLLGNQAQRSVTPTPATAIKADEIAGTRVLLVEDDPLIRFNTADMLQDVGCTVIEAGTAEEAIAALEAETIDLIVTDINLPGMSGVELADRARRLQHGIGIVFATGDGHRAADAAVAGDVVLSKPYDSANLTASIKSAVAARPVPNP